MMLGICENATPHWGTKRIALKAGLDPVKCGNVSEMEMYRKWKTGSSCIKRPWPFRIL